MSGRVDLTRLFSRRERASRKGMVMAISLTVDDGGSKCQVSEYIYIRPPT